MLKHPVALRLLMGHLMRPTDVIRILESYAAALADRRAELEAVRKSLGDDEAMRFPALVAEWGLAYYDSEREITDRTRARLEE
nr:hypothetical protein [Solicola gregarius]